MSSLEKSTNTRLVPLTAITIDRDIRQRRELTGIEDLAASLTRIGLINAVVIHADGRLIAGERRLEAARSLGWTEIRATVKELLSEIDAQLLELLENIDRADLPWPDMIRAVENYHEFRKEGFKGWTVMGTARDLGSSEEIVRRQLMVADYLADPDVLACKSWSAAFNLLDQRGARQEAAAQSRISNLMGTESLDDLLPSAPATIGLEELEGDEPLDPKLKRIEALKSPPSILPTAKAITSPADLVLQADFLQWVQTYSGGPFDVLHCDFPYGKGYVGHRGRATGEAHTRPVYDDSAETFTSLLTGLLADQDKLALSSAHCLFWLDLSYYQFTIDSFVEAGWKLATIFPLIWDKGYAGIASDVKRRPRHCYETALLFSRGDRQLRRLDSDIIAAPPGDKVHMSEKPQVVLRQFLSMLVDQHTEVLDPTCGSGSALVAAHRLGAARVLGLELDHDNAAVARGQVAKALNAGLYGQQDKVDLENEL